MAIKNNLNALIQSRKLNSNGTLKVREIEEDIATKCNISREAVVSIKRERMVPSLRVALSISAYFNTDVNKIFYEE